jgi:hypothetical protein
MKLTQIITRSLLLAGAVTALAMPVVGTLDANASTGGCTQGVYAGYCSTQTDAETAPLSFDVYRQGAFVGNKVIGFVNSDTDKATDFFTFKYAGAGATGFEKVFEYAPNGVASNLCISEPSKGVGLVLRTCNGSKWQRFTTTQVGSTNTFTWTNSATGDLVTANGPAKQLTGVASSTAVPAPAIPATQAWSFSG